MGYGGECCPMHCECVTEEDLPEWMPNGLRELQGHCTGRWIIAGSDLRLSLKSLLHGKKEPEEMCGKTESNA